MGFLSSHGEVSFETLKKAVIAGSAVASFCVEKFGTQRLEEITQKDIAERMSMLHQLSHFELTGYGAA
jgi:hypothetical protein